MTEQSASVRKVAKRINSASHSSVSNRRIIARSERTRLGAKAADGQSASERNGSQTRQGKERSATHRPGPQVRQRDAPVSGWYLPTAEDANTQNQRNIVMQVNAAIGEGREVPVQLVHELAAIVANLPAYARTGKHHEHEPDGSHAAEQRQKQGGGALTLRIGKSADQGQRSRRSKHLWKEQSGINEGGPGRCCTPLGRQRSS